MSWYLECPYTLGKSGRHPPKRRMPPVTPQPTRSAVSPRTPAEVSRNKRPDPPRAWALGTGGAVDVIGEPRTGISYGQFRAGVGVAHPRFLSPSSVERLQPGNGAGGGVPPRKL